MAWLLAELRGQERLHEIPGHLVPGHAATEADDVHVVVLDALPGGEVIGDERSADSRNLVDADRDADAAAAERDPALDGAAGHRLSERNREVRIVVARL